jgi:dihydrofolate reductase
MGKLIYSALTSLDGYIEDPGGKFDWAEPDAEVHAFVNDLERPVGTHLLGRRMYDVLVYWETVPLEGQPPYIREFAEIWRAADKIVYSKTLETASSARTRIEPDFDPETVRKLKAAAERDLTVGGPELAARAFRAGLVDEVHLFLAPVVVGAARQLSQPMSTSSSSCWTSGGSRTAWFTSATARGRENGQVDAERALQQRRGAW